MATQKSLFNNYKQCDICKGPLPEKYQGNTCPYCTEAKLFHQVKDYIRNNDVNEYQVAEHFHIPLYQVKVWIREGRIEYKTSPNDNSINGLHCQRCGAPVNFGALCPKCLKQVNGGKGYHVKKRTDDDDEKMRFLDH